MSSPQETPANEIFCPKCGQKNPENSYKCTQCGFVLHSPPPGQPAAGDGTLGGLIPFRNAMALSAYYCGVFSLIPCLGLPLAIAAVVLGILGLRFAKRHPESRGKVHAWVGIILGTLVLVATTAIILLMVFFQRRRG